MSLDGAAVLRRNDDPFVAVLAFRVPSLGNDVLEANGGCLTNWSADGFIRNDSQ